MHKKRAQAQLYFWDSSMSKLIRFPEVLVNTERGLLQSKSGRGGFYLMESKISAVSLGLDER